MHSWCIMCIRMKNGTRGGYLMLKKLKRMLLVGCMTLCTVSGVQAATLEDSMLKPPSEEHTTEKVSSFSTGRDELASGSVYQ